MNAPEREVYVVLQGDETLLKYKEAPKVPNAGILNILKEDHTIGNMLRMQLLQDSDVVFAGYKVPHPLENKIEVMVQTTESKDPLGAVNEGIAKLTEEMGLMQNRLQHALDKAEKPPEDTKGV